jgi:16S rRNA (guanine966-N2)-methyltransferase
MSTHRNPGSRNQDRLKKAKDADVRPIGARALKSAIDTLRPYLPGSKVLDLYCGQGRFGAAALEEGAEAVTFVDINRTNTKTLASQLKKYGDAPTLIAMDALDYLKMAAEKGHKFDIVFADPPFPFWNEKYSGRLVELVQAVLQSDSIFLVKHPSRVVASLPIYGFAEWKTTQFGESLLIYFKYL